MISSNNKVISKSINTLHLKYLETDLENSDTYHKIVLLGDFIMQDFERGKKHTKNYPITL